MLINSLVASRSYSINLYYSKECTFRLELHLRTWIAVLERVCFSPICLTKELLNKVSNSLAKFAEIHQKIIGAIEGLENSFEPNNFDQFNYQKDGRNEKITKNRNYNIDFLLIHLRDTLYSLRDDETWLQEIRRTKYIYI